MNCTKIWDPSDQYGRLQSPKTEGGGGIHHPYEFMLNVGLTFRLPSGLSEKYTPMGGGCLDQKWEISLVGVLEIITSAFIQNLWIEDSEFKIWTKA